jgi:predicted PurR-regulated permease PerM
MNDSVEQRNLETTKNIIDVAIRLGVLLLLVIACFKILSPFIVAVIWGAIIAVAIYPLFVKLRSALGERNKLAAGLYTLIALVSIILPTLMIAASAVETVGVVNDRYQAGTLKIPPPNDKVKDWPLVGKRLHTGWSKASVSLTDELKKYKPQLATLGKTIATFAAGGGLAVLQFVLSIIISGILVAYAPGAQNMTIKIFSRLAGGALGQHYTDLSKATIRSVAQGVIGVAAIQAVLGGLGMFVMDVPGWGLWTLLILVFAIAQLPPLLVLGPVIVYVFSVTNTTPAVVFMIYSLIVSASDGFLKPLFLGSGMDTPMLVILLGAIGGMLSAGIIGLFIGAIVLALGYELFMAWLNNGVTEPTADEVT